MSEESKLVDSVANVVDEITSKYLIQIKQERNDQLTIINNTLKSFMEQLSNKSSATTPLDDNALGGAINDSKNRQKKIIDDIRDAHKKQLEMLKDAISEERRDAAVAQKVFEETLHTKYENLVLALQEKIKDEQEIRMQRALDDLEKNARAESERAKQSFETQQSVERALSVKFKTIVADLRRSWEDEELSRAKQMEERVRSHYSAVLEHMEAQLKMALQLNDEADKQWMQDVEARNKQQVATIQAFEAKCRQLYDTRLNEYTQRTDQQLADYEQQLLEAGSAVAIEKQRFESRQRRLQIACSRWKLQYQKELHERYTEAVGALENRYIIEIEKLLHDLAECRVDVKTVTSSVSEKERNAIKSAVKPTHIDGSASRLSEDLTAKWDELGAPIEERNAALITLLDTAVANPKMIAKYEELVTKLNAKIPIVQLLSRKQYVEYKLKYAMRDNTNVTEQGALSTELRELEQEVQRAIGSYELVFREKYVLPARLTTPAKR